VPLVRGRTALGDNHFTMATQDFKLLVSVVVSAEDERQAHDACRDLVDRTAGSIMTSGDCSDEEPGCWSVTIGKDLPDVMVHNDAATLARTVRTFIRELAPGTPLPTVCCEPPTAWTVLDDPDLVGQLVPGAERLLVEAWSERVPPLAPVAQPQAENSAAATAVEQATRLRLRVDVATGHPAGAQWQARALTSRVVDTAVITQVVERPDEVSVYLELGRHGETPDRAVLAAAEALGRSNWAPLSWDGRTAVLTWTDPFRAGPGIIGLELTANQMLDALGVAWPAEDEP